MSEKIKNKLEAEKSIGRFSSWFYMNVLLYGNAFSVWWDSEGMNRFIKWAADNHGLKFTPIIKKAITPKKTIGIDKAKGKDVTVYPPKKGRKK